MKQRSSPYMDNDCLCRGFKGSDMCLSCARYKPGALTPKHVIAPLGKNAKECTYKKKLEW